MYGDEPTTFWGRCANENDISKGIAEIHDVIVNEIAETVVMHSSFPFDHLLSRLISLLDIIICGERSYVTIFDREMSFFIF